MKEEQGVSLNKIEKVRTWHAGVRENLKIAKMGLFGQIDLFNPA
jgi:hypothetical protein